jgi:hypothetical protein
VRFVSSPKGNSVSRSQKDFRQALDEATARYDAQKANEAQVKFLEDSIKASRRAQQAGSADENIRVALRGVEKDLKGRLRSARRKGR